MGEETAILKLVPSNWFYNLSVYGFLRVLNDECKIDLEKEGVFKEDGTVTLSKDILHQVDLNDLIEGLEKKSLISKERLFGGQKAYFSNTSLDSKKFKEKIQNIINLTFSKGRNEHLCILCYTITKTNYQFNTSYGNLASAGRSFPNTYWNMVNNIYLCPICAGLAYFHISGFIKLNTGEGIFINTPSFKLIWELNRHLEKIHSKEATENIKTLFGSAFINLVLDLNVKLGLWQRLSTEVIVFYNNNIDFYEIPPQIIELLEDKEISRIVIKLNNFKILKLIMSGNFKFLESLISRFLRSFYAKSIDNDELLKEFNLNQSNPQTGILLAKLYALIVDKLKKSSEVLI
jgi:CRISPR-associated protein Cst1